MPKEATLTAPAPEAKSSAADSSAPATAAANQDDLVNALAGMFEDQGSSGPTATPEGTEQSEPPAAASPDGENAADVLNSLTAEAGEGEAPPTTADGEETETDKDKGDADPKGVKKRIGSLLAEKRQLEAERAKLAEELDARTKELEEVRAQSKAPVSDDPADAVPEIAKVKDDLAKARGVKDYARQLLKRLDMDPDGVIAALKEGKVPMKDESPEAVRDWLEGVADKAGEDLAELRADLAMKRARFGEYQEAQRVQSSQEAIRHYPWLKDQNSQEFKTAAEVLKAVPQLKKHPAIMLALGDMIAGAKARVAKANGAGVPAKPVAKSVPSVPVSSPQPPPSGGRSALRAASIKDPDGAMSAFLGAVLQ